MQFSAALAHCTVPYCTQTGQCEGVEEPDVAAAGLPGGLHHLAGHLAGRVEQGAAECSGYLTLPGQPRHHPLLVWAGQVRSGHTSTVERNSPPSPATIVRPAWQLRSDHFKASTIFNLI